MMDKRPGLYRDKREAARHLSIPIVMAGVIWGVVIALWLYAAR